MLPSDSSLSLTALHPLTGTGERRKVSIFIHTDHICNTRRLHPYNYTPNRSSPPQRPGLCSEKQHVRCVLVWGDRRHPVLFKGKPPFPLGHLLSAISQWHVDFCFMIRNPHQKTLQQNVVFLSHKPLWKMLQSFHSTVCTKWLNIVLLYQ